MQYDSLLLLIFFFLLLFIRHGIHNMQVKKREMNTFSGKICIDRLDQARVYSATTVIQAQCNHYWVALFTCFSSSSTKLYTLRSFLYYERCSVNKNCLVLLICYFSTSVFLLNLAESCRAHRPSGDPYPFLLLTIINPKAVMSM